MIRTLLALFPEGSGRRVSWHLVLTALGVLIRAAGAVLLVPLVAALFSDTPRDAWVWVGLLGVATIVGWMVDTATVRAGFALGFGVLDTGQRRVADQITRVRLTWLTNDHTALTRQAVASTGPDLVGLIIYFVTPLIGSVLLSVAIALALLPVAWQLGVAALAGVPVLLAAFWLSGRLSRRADRVADETNVALTERVLEFARTQQALRAARRVDPERSLVGDALAAQHGASIRLLLLQIPGQIIFGIASQIALILLAGTVVLLSVSGELTAPQAIALIVVIVRYLEPFTMLAELSPGVEATTGALRRMRDVLSAPVDPAGTTEQRFDRAQDIELRGIGFAYGEDSPAVLDEFDLVLEAGTTTAIVGPSGSGKSTVLSLIAGLLHPTAGRILVGGVDAHELDEASRRALVSVVFQHPYLFSGGIEENIRVGQPDADAREFEEAVALAQVPGIIAGSPAGWETRVGEAGSVLSGGERQRVSIARALLKRAPILLIDEATSALDTENEAAVAAAIAGDPQQRTRVIVAHRLSSIRSADRVLFLEGGRIVEDGTVDGLLSSGGRFAEFWREQRDAGTWQLGAER